jgi:hypothetical protein
MQAIELPTKAADFLRDNAPRYAQAKAQRIYLEQFRKSKKALLMGQCDDKTIAAKEMFAYAHHDYIALLDGLREAVEAEEKVRWQLTAAELKIEIWRTESANNRRIDHAHR